MAGLKPPGTLDIENKTSKVYSEWLRAYDIFAIATGVDQKDEKVQCNVFLHVAGEAAQKVFATFTFGDSEADKIAPLKARFKAYCEGKKNITVVRYNFNSRNQKQGETFDAYLTELRNLVKECEYKDLETSLLLDRVIGGIVDETLRQRLLQVEDLTLEKCIDIARLSEIQLKPTIETHAVKKGQKYNRPSHRSAPTHKPRPKQQTPQQTSHGPRPNHKHSTKKCGNCGKDHTRQQPCPAYGQKCHGCGKFNHFICVCRKTNRKTHAVEAYEYDDDADDDSSIDIELFAGALMIDSIGTHSSAWTETFTMRGHAVTFKLDTGSEADVLPLKDFEKISGATLKPPRVRLRSYSGHRIMPVGETDILLKGLLVTFQVVDLDVFPILGRDTCSNLGLIVRVMNIDTDAGSRSSIVEEFRDVFTGLGCVQSNYHLYTDPTVEPAVDPPRRIPHAIRDQVKEELDRMVKIGVIKPQKEPTPWVNSMTIVKKKDKLRVCIDPTKLNKAIRRAHYPTKTVEEVAASMPNAILFSTFDAKCGYWQIALDDESSKLCTFNSPWGRFRFTRVPFGINTSGDIFNSVMTELFQDLEGVEIIVDDILVHGSTKQEHDIRVRRMLERAREVGLKLNPQKARVGLDQVDYVGHTISKEGLKPNTEYVKAIVDMPEPSSKEDVHRFVAMCGYLQKFIPNLSTHTKPLRQLIEQKVEWHWESHHQKAFQTLKTLVSTTPVLKLYDVNKPVTLQVDSSKSGIGAVISQDGHPVAYGSKALDQTQSNYAVIERELLGICYGCSKFHDFIFGKNITVETDHKPLVAIMTKPLHVLPARIQRMRMRLQRYDLKVTYRPGKQMFIADTLSRAATEDEKTSDLFDDELEVCMLKMSSKKADALKKATAEDVTLQKLKTAILHGWPRAGKDVDILPYQTYYDELSFEDGLIFKGTRIIIPKCMQQEMLKTIHEPHLGIVKSKQLARDAIFWPGLACQIEDMVSRCSICQEHRNSPAAEPMIPHEIPDGAWQKVATDLFEYNGKKYLACVDYYSKYPEIVLLQTTTSSAVISALKTMFARFGIPTELVSDNGPQFSSYQFKQFAEAWDFEHVTTSPRYPQANGQIERTVQTFKKLLKKCEKAKTDLSIVLLNYRNTALGEMKSSPAQLLMGRRLRTKLPTRKQLLEPRAPSPSTHRHLKRRQNNQKYYYDQRAGTTKPNLRPGEQVRVKSPQGTWARGTVLNEVKPRSYTVRTSGATYRRNRRHIFPTREQPQADQPRRPNVPIDIDTKGSEADATLPANTSPARRYSPRPRRDSNPEHRDSPTAHSPAVASPGQRSSPVHQTPRNAEPRRDVNPRQTANAPPVVYTRSGRRVKPVKRMDL